MANNKNYLIAENSSSFPDNIDRLITPAILRNFNADVITSMYDDISGSFAATISGSIFPDTNALEVFTQSANIRLNNLEGATASYANSASVAAVDSAQQSQIDSLIAFTGSVSSQTLTDTVYNGEATTIVKGTPLYVSGSQGANPIVYRADAAVASKMPVIYIANANITTGTTGEAILLGHIEGMDLTGIADGTLVYVAEGGGWATTRPSGSSSIVQPLGIVTKGGSGGKGEVLNPGPATLPNIQTGYVWAGNGSNQPTAVATSSFGTSINTGSFATTGSNTFYGDEVFSGSVTISTNTRISLVPSSSVGGGSALRFYTKPIGSSPEKILNIQSVPGISENLVAISNMSSDALNQNEHMAFFDLDNQKISFTSQINIETQDDGTVAKLKLNSGTGSSILDVTNGLTITGEGAGVGIVSSLPSYELTGSIKHSGVFLNVGNAQITGSLTTSQGATIGGNLVANKVSCYDFDTLYYGSQLGGTTANGTFFGYGSTDYTATFGAYGGAFDNELQTYVDSTGIYLKDFNGGGYSTFLKLLPNAGSNPKPIMTRGLEVTGSTNIAELTASLQQGYVWVGDASGRTTTVATSSFGGGGTIDTSSFATTGSNTFNGDQIISGSVYVSGSINLRGEGADGFAFSGKALFLTNSVQTGITVESPIHFYQVGKGDFYITNNVAGVGSGSMNMIAANGGNLNISASAVSITPVSVSTNAGYPIPFLSSNVVSIDSVNTLMYNPSTNQLYVSASTGQSIITPNGVSFTSGSGQYGTYAASTTKTGYVHTVEGGNYIGMMANPSKTGAPSLTSNTNPAIVALSGSGVPYVALEFQPSGSTTFTDGSVVAKRKFVAEAGLVVSSSFNVGTTSAATIGATVLNLNGTTDVNMATPNVSIRNTGGDTSFRLFRGTGGTQKAWWTNITNTGASGSYIIQDAQNSKDYITLGGVSSNTSINTNTNINGVLNLAPQTTLPAGTIGDLAVSGSALYFYDGSWRQVSLV